jgi:hypothetical protein
VKDLTGMDPVVRALWLEHEALEKLRLTEEEKVKRSRRLADVEERQLVRARRDDTLEIEETPYQPETRTFLAGPDGAKKPTTYTAIDLTRLERKRVVRLPKPQVKKGARSLVDAELRRDPMSRWAKNSLEELYAWGPEHDGEVDLFDGLRPENRPRLGQTRAFDAVEAASGGAMWAFARERGEERPRPKDAGLVVRYVAGQLKPWEERKLSGVLRRLEDGEIRDKDGRRIVKRQRPLGNPINYADALVDLAMLEGEQ